MDIYHVLIRPLVTEKSTHQAQTTAKDRGGIYHFQVHADARKPEIRDAVEKVYGVKVMSVRTTVHKGKHRRFRQHLSKLHPTKKAIVTLDPNSHIDLF